MTKETTAKRQRVTLDDTLWPIFIEACGGKCCDCGATDRPLHHGHIWRAEDGGPATLENLQPICKPCNGKYNQHFHMPELRPANWRSRFIELVVRTFREGVAALPKNTEGVNTLPAQNFPENVRVVVRNDGIFAADCELPHTLIPGNDTLPLDAILTTVEDLIAAGLRQDVPIPVPDDKCQEALKRLIRRAGRKDFLAARDEFLLRRDWYDQDQKFGRVTRVGGDPWPKFVNGFSVYLKMAKARPQEPTIEQIKARDMAYVKAHAQQMGVTPTVKKPETKKSRLLASIALLGQRLLKGELKGFPKAYWEEVARIKKLVDAASDSDELLDVYESQLRTASMISRWRAESSEPE